MTFQVQGNGELQPIYYNGNPNYTVNVPNGDPTVVTHRDKFQCPTSSPALAARSASSSGERCEEAENLPPRHDSCYQAWRLAHTHAAGSGHTGY
ncbi:hypothetical protein EAF04_010438 [Stromatinia cepivora]|nr:hypothetical protein EAF04_010438 [Stromatinia cepivora]